MEPFSTPLLEDVQLNPDGSLKQTGKQNIKFYNKKVLSFRAIKDEAGNITIDPKTGLPKKEAFEEVKTFIRVETKGDTNIKDDVADDFSKRQFYRQYKFFREGRIPDGNPIEDFDFLQPQTILELHMLGVHVIQQLAELSDIACEQLKDQAGYEIRDIAAQWVKVNSPESRFGQASKLEIENANLRRELSELRGGRSEPRRVMENSTSASEMVVEEPMKTVELTPEEMAAKRKARERKV